MLWKTFSVAALISVLGGTPLVPASLAAQADRKDQQADRKDQQQERRYYDKEHKTYHVWTQDEDQRYRKYLSEQKRTYRDFGQLNATRQRDYWRWRENHADDQSDHR